MLISKEVNPKWLIPVILAGALVFVGLLWIIIRLIIRRAIVIRELRESEEKFSKAFESSPYAIMVTNVESGAFTEVNNAFVLLSGFSRKEALAGPSSELKLWVNEKIDSL